MRAAKRILAFEIDFCDALFMGIDAVLGVDVGTSSSKGVLVSLDGRVPGSATREHVPSRPHADWVEMEAEPWWQEFVEIARELGKSNQAHIDPVISC